MINGLLTHCASDKEYQPYTCVATGTKVENLISRPESVMEPEVKPEVAQSSKKKRFRDVAMHSLVEIINILVKNGQKRVLEEYIEMKLALEIGDMHEAFLEGVVHVLEPELQRTDRLKII